MGYGRTYQSCTASAPRTAGRVPSLLVLCLCVTSRSCCRSIMPASSCSGHATGVAHTNGRVFYHANRKACCEANSVHAADLSSWFKVEASVAKVETFEATVYLRLLFWDVGHGTPKWKALRWEDLGEMHGRRVHASVVSFDLHAAWHVHPPDSTAASASELRLVLGLPPRRAGDESALQARLLVNFGVRCDAPAVELCVSEESVHIDPDDNREMLVEGLALSAPFTLREASGISRLPLAPDFGATRTLAPLPLEGRGQDEIAAHRAITRDLETRDRVEAQPGEAGLEEPEAAEASTGCASGSCGWRVRLGAGRLDGAAFGELKREVAHPLTPHP